MKKHKKKLFFRIKSGDYSVMSDKYKIGKDGKVDFKEKFLIRYYFAPPEELDRPKLHFSFRIEKYDGTMTQKYGVQNITNLEYNQINPVKMYHIEFKLEKCKEDPFVSCDISIYHSSEFSLYQLSSHEAIEKSSSAEYHEDTPENSELSQDSESDSDSYSEKSLQSRPSRACFILLCLIGLLFFKLFYIFIYGQNLWYEYQHNK